MTQKVVHLMRGLPSSGKSHTAREIAGTRGVVLETDAFFHTEVGDDPTCYDYRHDLLPAARQWNFERFLRAIDDGVPVVVVDRGNSLSADSQRYARRAIDKGYHVELTEPRSKWWREIRVLLKYKRYTKPVLVVWAERLSELNKRTHRVPARRILHLMARWRYDLTIEDVLSFRERHRRPSEMPAADSPHFGHVVGFEQTDKAARQFDPMAVARDAGVPVLPTDFGVSTARFAPKYFDPNVPDDAGNDGSYDGEPSRADMIFDEETGLFSKQSGDGPGWVIEGDSLSSRHRDHASADDEWIIHDMDFGERASDVGAPSSNDADRSAGHRITVGKRR